jgi:hydrogenase expression/formation protein HypE
VSSPSCPTPLGRYEHIVLGHGSGGRLTHDLVTGMFLPAFRNDALAALEDQAIVRVAGARIAFTTDAFVVRPIFFPGGDVGKLAVHGTVNDLAVGGAVPLFLSAAFILEEGLALPDLERVVASMRAACEEANVKLVTGDTKVVERGKGDRIFITTAGVGVVPEGVELSAANARPGDRVLLSGTVGDHGVAVLSVREGLEFETALESDTCPLHGLASAILEAAPGAVRCMRDPTRGGLATALNEIARASRVAVAIDEAAVPVRDGVKGACELLGLDPLYVANEGKLVAVAAPDAAPAVLAAMRAHEYGRDAAIVGEVTAEAAPAVVLRSIVRGTRILPMLAGEQLPRIC